jgi:hypothetical protein
MALHFSGFAIESTATVSVETTICDEFPDAYESLVPCRATARLWPPRSGWF